MEKKISLPSNGSGLFGNDLSLDLSLRLACMRLDDNFIHCFYRKAQFSGTLERRKKCN
jgi:hypothetical protein